MKKQENKITYFVLERDENGNPIDCIKSIGNSYMRYKITEGSYLPEISEPSLEEVNNFIKKIEDKKEMNISSKPQRRGKR